VHSEIIALINLLNVPQLGPHRVRLLLSVFGTAEKVFTLSREELCSVEGIDIKLANAIRSYQDFEIGEREVVAAREKQVKVISFWDPEYPFLLKKIYDPPVLLYVKGQLRDQEDCVAVVGTRAATTYGRSVTRQLVKGLVEKGITIVSGLARGIDTEAHRETIRSGGRTLAILGSGIDVIYPAENRNLAREIMEHGALISEFPMGAKPDAGNFPQRNRIISGLSHGTVVVEAGNRSGAILTALNAVDQNREVFAVPGRITDRQSQGCIRLIRNGAIPVQHADQILQHLGHRLFKPLSPRQQTLELRLSKEQSLVVKYLSHDPIHIDDLAHKSGMEITRLLTLLLELELIGVVQQLSGKQFVLAV
jgi:DNA processing protein